MRLLSGQHCFKLGSNSLLFVEFWFAGQGGRSSISLTTLTLYTLAAFPGILTVRGSSGPRVLFNLIERIGFGEGPVLVHAIFLRLWKGLLKMSVLTWNE